MKTFSRDSLFSACVVPLCRKRAPAPLILDFAVEKESACRRDALDLPRSLFISLPFAHSRLRRPREWPRIMTLLRGRLQLMAIKTLVIAVGELRNYHVTANVAFRRSPECRFRWLLTLMLIYGIRFVLGSVFFSAGIPYTGSECNRLDRVLPKSSIGPS